MEINAAAEQYILNQWSQSIFDIDTYNKLKENSNDELKEIFNKYLNKW